MDVHNVSEQYVHMIERQKQTLREAKKRQGERPRDRKSKEMAYVRFMVALKTIPTKPENLGIHSSIIPPAYQPCITPLAQLRRVKIKDLQLEIHHRGTYLLLRSITPPSRMTAIMAITEDENGDALMLQIYQQEDEKTRAATSVVDTGTILLIKEPYFKVMGDGEYGLRVDHLSDIIHLERDDGRIPDKWRPRLITTERSADALKMKGNQAMHEGRFWDAIAEYSDALGQQATANEIEIIKRNRSLAYLKTKQFDAALSDTGFPNFGPNPVERAMFRAAEALYNLEQYIECCRVLELLRGHFPENSLAVSLLDRAKRRCREQSTGVYDFGELQREAKKLQPPHLDHATYIGPVEIRQAGSKGRGLFVTKAVKAGDLLLCEKAFSSAYVDEGAAGGGNVTSKISLLINPETNQGTIGAHADLITLTVQKLYRNPSLASAFTTLHHGAYEGVSTTNFDGKPIVDTFLVERIISFNVFGCPISSLVNHLNNRDEGPGLELAKIKEEKAHHSCGIWIHASYINHKCTSNACRAFIGNMMVVRASQDMEAGTEITFWYREPVASAKEIQERHKIWNFVCDCAICADNIATSPAVLTKRRKLNEDLKQVFGSVVLQSFHLKKIQRLLDALNGTYTQPVEKVPRLLLWDAQSMLTLMYAAKENESKAMESVGKVLTSVGFVFVGADFSSTRFAIIKWGLMLDHLVHVFLQARNVFAVKGAMEDSVRAEEYARTTYKIIFGEDSSFSLTYG